MTLLEIGLVAVGGQHGGRGHLQVVGDEREAAVGRGIEGDLFGVDLGGDGEHRPLVSAVAGVGPSATTVFLGEGLLV
jgi:hypothetical protein